MSELKNRVHDLLPGLLGDLEDLVRIQSVSADPGRLGDVEESARKTAQLLAAEGVVLAEALLLQRLGNAQDRIQSDTKDIGGH